MQYYACSVTELVPKLMNGRAWRGSTKLSLLVRGGFLELSWVLKDEWKGVSKGVFVKGQRRRRERDARKQDPDNETAHEEHRTDLSVPRGPAAAEDRRRQGQRALQTAPKSSDFPLRAAEDHGGDSIGGRSSQRPMRDYTEDGYERDKTSWQRVSFTY